MQDEAIYKPTELLKTSQIEYSNQNWEACVDRKIHFISMKFEVNRPSSLYTRLIPHVNRLGKRMAYKIKLYYNVYYTCNICLLLVKKQCYQYSYSV